jgi:hypothetical protein
MMQGMSLFRPRRYAPVISGYFRGLRKSALPFLVFATALFGGLFSMTMHAAVTVDATSQQFGAIGTTSLIFTHTLGSGSNRLVVCGVQIANPTAAVANITPSVTFDGIAMTAIAGSQAPTSAETNSSKIESEMFYLNDASLGAASGPVTVDVELPSTPTGGVAAGCTSFFGIAQTAPETVGTAYEGSGSPSPSASLTTATADDLIVDSFAGGFTASANPTKSAAPNTGQTQLSDNQLSTAGILAGSSYEILPVAGSVTVGWTQGSTGVSRDAYSAAAFAATVTTNYTLTTSVNPVGSGTVSLSPSASSYASGTSVQVTATPAAYDTFANFTDGSGNVISSSNPATVIVNANTTVVANFTQTMCTLTIATAGTGAGTTSPSSGSYACGSAINLAAMANTGFNFWGWSGTGYTGSSSSTSFLLTGNITETATFNPGTPCTLTTSVTGTGTITPSAGYYTCGATISIAAVAGDHYIFSGWGGALSGSTTPSSLTLSSNMTVTANFDYNTTGITGDSRTVTEPVYPPVCTVLTASQQVSAPTEVADTARVQAALSACVSGNAVEFSASADGADNAFVIAPITLPAGVTMLVDPEVTILGSIKYADYNCNTTSCTPLIDIAANTYPNPGSAIMGLGVIDGRGGTTLTDIGESWWATVSDARPRLIYLSNYTTGARSDNFTAYKITLKNSPKFHISGVGNDWTVWGVKIIAPPDSPNTDGVDPSGSNNVTVTQSYISDGDDWVSPKADSGHVSNITVGSDHMYSGHGVSIGSETNAGLNNMFVHDLATDNDFGGTSFDTLRIKSGESEGGEVYDVLYKNICINYGGDTIVIDPYYMSTSGMLYPDFHDITFSNVHKLIHDSSHKSMIFGFGAGSSPDYPTSVTFDNVAFDNDTANDFEAGSTNNFYNAQFSFGPGPVSFEAFLEADAAVPANLITTTNNITDPSESAYDCTDAFVYLAGDLTSKAAAQTGSHDTTTAGAAYTLTAVLQNVVSPTISGGVSSVYLGGTTSGATVDLQTMPTGTIDIMEGTTKVGSGTVTGNSRLTYITIPGSDITTGTHTYTAFYEGDSNFAALSFGSFTLIVQSVAPVANNQSVTVAYNTPTPIALSATGTGTLTYTVVTIPAHGKLTGTAPNLTYTPAGNYSGSDSFTFDASNGAVSNVATIAINVAQASLTWSVASGGSLAATIAAGQTATYDLQLAGSAGLTGAVSFSCTGAPSYSTCAVTSSSSSLNGTTPVPVTVTVSTRGASAKLERTSAPGSRPGSKLPIVFTAGVTACLFGFRKRAKLSRVPNVCAICILMVIGFLVTACGGGTNSAPVSVASGSYTLTVTATSGGATQSVPLTLIVQ